MRWVFLLNISRLFLKAQELGIQVIAFTFYRSPEDQAKEFAAGRSRTVNGYHPLWLAIDLAVVNNLSPDAVVSKDQIRWQQDPPYVTLGQYWETLGGVWGGRWKDPHDIYHFEWAKGLRE